MQSASEVFKHCIWVRCDPARLRMFVVQCFVKPPPLFLFITPAGTIEIVYSECVSHFTLTHHSILDVWDLSGNAVSVSDAVWGNCKVSLVK